MKMIATEKAGLVIHLHQEGRGQGLSHKIAAIGKMQVEQIDTVEAFNKLNLEQDVRSYAEAIKLLAGYGIKKLRLISNNPRKLKALEDAGIEVETVSTNPNIRPENIGYLYSKNLKLNHTLPLNKIIDETSDIHFYHSDQVWGEFSNFSAHPIFLKNRIWQTVEHYYQAQKFSGSNLEEIIHAAESPMRAKEIANLNKERYDKEKWHALKEGVMLEALKAKFSQHPQLAKKLADTKNRHIAEHTSNDFYWADGGNNSGQNRLGELIMEVRQNLLKS